MRKITVKDIAEKAGVSTAAVSRTLNGNGYVSSDKKQRILEAAKDLNYSVRIPIDVYEQFDSKEICLITGVSLESELILSPYSLMSTSVINEANSKGFGPVNVISLSKVNSENILNSLSVSRGKNYSGIIITGFADRKPSFELVKYLKSLGVPVVFIEHVKGCEAFNRVYVDNASGIYAAAENLLNKGHRHILYVTHDKGLVSSPDEERLSGINNAIKDFCEESSGSGNEPPELMVIHSPMDRLGIQAAGYEAIKEALNKDPEITAVLNWADGFVPGELQYLAEKGLHCPNDIEIIGHDDVLAKFLTPAVSSVHFPYSQCAEAAIEIIQNSISDPGNYCSRSITLVPRFIQR